jgi:hypothetical protein
VEKAEDAAADGEVGLAGLHLGRGHVHRLEARGAEAVDLDAGRGLGPAGVEHGGAGDVGALLADRRDAAEDDVVDLRGVEAVAVAQGLQHLGGEAQRGDLVQRAVLLALAARGADRIVDVGVGHGELLGLRREGAVSKRARQKPYVYVNVK